MGKTPFKMKSSPAKGKLDNFFKGLGAQLKQGQQERGIFSEAGRAEKKSRKPGESKYQADVRRRREGTKTAKTKPIDIESSSVFEPTKFGYEGKSFFGPTTSDLERKLMMSDKRGKTLNLKSDVFDLSGEKSTTPKTFSRGGGDPYSYRTKEGGGFEFQSLKGRGGRTKGEWYPAKGGVEKIQAAYEKALNPTPIEKKSPTRKRSGFKMKNSPAKDYKKGYYGVK